MNIYLDLFITFVKIGGLTFGGGYAMLPMIEREVVDRKKWATGNDVMDYFAIGQCTPGVIAVNTATAIGYKQKKIRGAICATLGVIFPSIVIISIIAAFLTHFADNPYVMRAMLGIRLGVGALVITAVVKLLKKSVIDLTTLIIFILGFVLITFFNISPVLIIVLAGITGVVVKALAEKAKVGKKQ